MSFFGVGKKVLTLKLIKRKTNERQKHRVAASKKTKVRISEARHVVTQKETSVGIRSSDW